MTTLLSVIDKIDAKTKKSISKDLIKEVCNVIYFKFIPLDVIANILVRYGVNASPLDGIYCGADGQSTAQVCQNLWIHLTWHKMEVSGKYEIVCYIS